MRKVSLGKRGLQGEGLGLGSQPGLPIWLVKSTLGDCEIRASGGPGAVRFKALWAISVPSHGEKSLL